MTTSRAKAITPIDILRNCRGKPVSVELVTGETVNGTVMRTDRAMNVVLKQAIRTGADGNTFWRSRECLLRGASVKNVRMDESALTVSTRSHKSAGPRGPAGAGKASAHKEKATHSAKKRR